MANPRTQVLLRRAVAEIALLTAAGLFLGVLGPFGTDTVPWRVKMAYWPIVIVGGGVIGIAIDDLIGLRLGGFWRRLIAVSLLMTPPTTAMVFAVSSRMLWADWGQRPMLASFTFQVGIICFGLMALRQVAWRGVWTPIGAEAPATGGSKETPDAFRQRLSAKRRAARLIAVEAEDHYLRVHTDAGDELITARFGDALDELAPLSGHQTHRSWWVAADAIEAVRWRRGRGELRLTCGLTVPVSRTHAAALKREGWF